MKKVLLAALLLLGMSFMFNACEKGGTKGNLNKTFAGNWIVQEDADMLDCYVEFTENGVMKGYVLNPGSAYATYENGTLYAPASNEWKLDATFQYSIADGLLFAADFYGMRIDVVNNDKIHLIDESGNYGGDAHLLRVKNFSTK